MRILIIGSGGREHTLAWKMAQSPHVDRLYVAPGNGGTASIAENVPIGVNDILALSAFARRARIDLTVVGPEAPLVAGVVDAFQAEGLRIFGPTAQAAQLEGSKAFAKRFMVEEGIPTAPAAIFVDYEAALSYLRQVTPPVVVKASGLAAGKGVLVCGTREEAQAALRQVMVARAFGAAGDETLIETCLAGEETSLLAFSDGQTVVPMLPARDYKRALDGDKGLNTGGMGGYAPSAYLPPDLVRGITARVLQTAVDGMRRRGMPYVGVLYAGLMLTEQGPRVLEFNCRFGDPETQMLLPLLESDLVEILLACTEGRLAATQVAWRPGFNVGVVLASGGYPGAYRKGEPISGLEAAGKLADAIFHAGTAWQEGRLVTAGGRVMAVNAIAPTLVEARERVYTAISHIHFDGMQYRSDIAVGPGERFAANDAARDESLFRVRPKGIGREPGAAAGGSAGTDGRRAGAYAAAGVDIDAGERAVALMRAAVRRTHTPAVLSDVGSFGGMVAMDALRKAHDLVLVATTDGVGTKTMLAAAMGRYASVGHDIVNHCVNDILVQGARPLFFLDYIAASKLDPEQVAAVVGGCAEACSAVGCALLGGETAEMPGVYHSGAFDLVGTMVGWVDREKIVDGQAIQPGDVCLGLPSSGLHTNGFSLVRRVFAGTGWETVLPELGRPLGEVLLTPHRAYLAELEALWRAGVRVKGMAHITGGGFFENIPRALPQNVGVRLDRDSWEVPAIFRVIQARGRVNAEEMYRVFNMGIGLVLVTAPGDAQEALKVLPELGVLGEAVTWCEGTPRVQF